MLDLPLHEQRRLARLLREHVLLLPIDAVLDHLPATTDSATTSKTTKPARNDGSRLIVFTVYSIGRTAADVARP